jgi:hypothetical protein
MPGKYEFGPGFVALERTFISTYWAVIATDIDAYETLLG